MIYRRITDSIKDNLKSGNKIIMILGARQVGKATLLKNFIAKENIPHLWINDDLAIYQEYLAVRNLEKIKELIENHKLVIIDEGQNIPNLGLNLKIIYDEMPEVKVIVTGSSSIDLSNSIQESLTGRKISYTLFPISLQELVLNSSKFEVRHNLEQYLLYGLYPEVLQLEGANRKKSHLKEIVNSYLYRDVLMLTNIRKSDKIFKLLQLLAYQIGSLVSIQELAQKLNLNHETLNRYIDLLEKSFVIKKISGYAPNPRKEISKMDKIYFIDIGIRNALIDNFGNIDIRSDIGAIWENFIVMERLKFLSYNYNSENIYFWKRYSGAEIDLVEPRDGVLNGIKIKWGKNRKTAPKSWLNSYPNSTFRCINKDTLFDILKL